jgi:glycosyltransferase involved in cell wall biosynthesis
VRVLHTVPSITDAYGGPVATLTQIGPLEHRLGRRPLLFTVDRPGRATSARCELDRWYDVRLTAAGALAGRYHGGRQVTAQLRRLVPEVDCVVFHSVFDFITTTGSALARRHGVPYMLASHGSLDEYDVAKHARAKRALSPLWRAVIDGAATVLCATDREADRLHTFGARPPSTAVIPIPYQLSVDRGDPVAARRRLGLGGNRRIVLFLGRLHPKKGLPLLMSAFDAVSRPDEVLVIAGRGEPRDEAAVRARAGELRHPDRVIFAGWVSGVEKADLLAASEVFALISENENFCHAAVEALDARLPVLLSDDVYLAGELARHGAARVVARTTADTAAGLRELLDDPVARESMAEAGRRFIADRLSIDAVMVRYASVFSAATTTGAAHRPTPPARPHQITGGS